VAEQGKILSINLAACKGCGVCEKVCPPKFNAIVMKEDQ
jgi:Pyruvate/2-oxoacid:ferredoxin oxidoreductase delta subunit